MHAADVLFSEYRFFQGRSSTKIVEGVRGGRGQGLEKMSATMFD